MIIGVSVSVTVTVNEQEGGGKDVGIAIPRNLVPGIIPTKVAAPVARLIV